MPAAPATQTSWRAWPSWCRTAAGCSSARLLVLAAHLPPYSVRSAPPRPGSSATAGHCRAVAALRLAYLAPLLGTLTLQTGLAGWVSGATAPEEGVRSTRVKAPAKWLDVAVCPHKWLIRIVQLVARGCLTSSHPDSMCKYGIYSRECTVCNVKCMINCIYLFIHSFLGCVSQNTWLWWLDTCSRNTNSEKILRLPTFTSHITTLS